MFIKFEYNMALQPLNLVLNSLRTLETSQRAKLRDVGSEHRNAIALLIAEARSHWLAHQKEVGDGQRKQSQLQSGVHLDTLMAYQYHHCIIQDVSNAIQQQQQQQQQVEEPPSGARPVQEEEAGKNTPAEHAQSPSTRATPSAGVASAAADQVDEAQAAKKDEGTDSPPKKR